jgi:DNA-binding transcriptional regulator YiaG
MTTMNEGMDAVEKGGHMTEPREMPTREQVARRTIDRLKKFSDHLKSGRPVNEAYSCRKVILEIEMQPYTAAMVKEVRGLLNVSQALFAKFLNVSLSAVQKWERGHQPDGAACRLLDEIRHCPEYWRARFASMAKTVSSQETADA